MLWVCGVVGYIAGTGMTLLAMAVMIGRSERRGRNDAANICVGCPYDR